MPEKTIRFLNEMGVSRETMDRLAVFHDLVQRWSKTINLVSKRDLGDLWGRHILDSLQLVALTVPKDSWCDLGSGGGFPGAVLAVVFSEIAPQVKVTCVESDLRKAEFLRNVSRETRTGFEVLNERIENVNVQADTVSARALATVDNLLELSQPIMKSKGKCLFLKGQGHKLELEAARQNWRFDVKIHRSITAEKSAVLEIGEVARVRP